MHGSSVTWIQGVAVQESYDTKGARYLVAMDSALFKSNENEFYKNNQLRFTCSKLMEISECAKSVQN